MSRYFGSFDMPPARSDWRSVLTGGAFSRCCMERVMILLVLVNSRLYFSTRYYFLPLEAAQFTYSKTRILTLVVPHSHNTFTTGATEILSIFTNKQTTPAGNRCVTAYYNCFSISTTIVRRYYHKRKNVSQPKVFRLTLNTHSVSYSFGLSSIFPSTY